MPKTPPLSEPGDDLPVETRDAVTASLEPGESIERSVPMVGAHLLLTDRHLVVVRHGHSYRPASGIRTWRLDHQLDLRIEPGRLLIDVRGSVVAVLYHAPQAVAIRSLVAAARRGSGLL